MGNGGNGKQWKWEMGDEKMGITAYPLCIQQHLEWTSATGDSGEEVVTIVYALA